MAQDNARRFPVGRSALGGASCGLTYDAALLDAVARETRLRRPLRLDRWQDPRPSPASVTDSHREPAELAKMDPSA